MTFSIVARSDDGTMFGVAVASKFLAAGAVVPEARAGIGALATQAAANLTYRPQGMVLLGEGRSPAEVASLLTGADDGRDERQLGVVGPVGDGATYTGAECMDWAGGVAGPGFAAQGNILTGPGVVEAMAEVWRAAAGTPFAERLLGALIAGDAAGGDRRGRQSAALFIVGAGLGYGGMSDVAVDLRVDDHPDPVNELNRLLSIHHMLFDKPDPAAVMPLQGDLAEEVRTLLAALGYGDGESGLDRALASWAGVENLEERLVPGGIDPWVLERLRGRI